MKLVAFRITSFRSIEDTGWHHFSPDNVSVLVGQNESGKSSVLEALSFAANHEAFPKDVDFRSDGSMPSVSLRINLDNSEIEEFCSGFKVGVYDLAVSALARNGGVFDLVTRFERGEDEMERIFEISQPIIPGMTDSLLESLTEQSRADREKLVKDYDSFLEMFVDEVPMISLFQEEKAGLPDSVILEGRPLFTKQVGARGALNFIKAAGLDTKTLLLADDRRRGTLIRTANSKINVELAKYWSQQFGGKRRITLEVEFSRYPSDHAEKPGAPYLSFWISEGDERFYPSQRSRGTRWFVSIFLHLLATERAAISYVVLLDEPGSFLHNLAQQDVKRLIERIADRYPIMYSTHIPALVDFTKPYRILAVERNGESELSDTQIYQALKISTASRETLSPILEKMGADMRHQSVIKHAGNVVLEEPSAHFYLRAFERLVGGGEQLSYIPASGVNNVPVIFSLMVAWGLKFCVLLDDDKQGREVRKTLTKNYFGDDPDVADKVIHRIKGCEGFEDLFSREDFFNVVLGGRYAAADGLSNSSAAKDLKIQKPVVAYMLYVQVEKGEISARDFSEATLVKFSELIDALRGKST